MMWFKREKERPVEKAENGVVGRLRRKKPVLLKSTRESERETSTESEKEKRRYSDILDIKVSQERRDESDESLYESADCHSDAISASEDALPHLSLLSVTPTMSKESLKLAITDEEAEVVKNKGCEEEESNSSTQGIGEDVDATKNKVVIEDVAKNKKDEVETKTVKKKEEEVEMRKDKKGHRKTMSLSNTLEIVKTFGDDWFDNKMEKNDKRKSKESLLSEEDKESRESIHSSTSKLAERKNSKKEDKSQSDSRKSSAAEVPKRKPSKGSSVSALNFLRRKKTPTTMKTVEAVAEAVDKIISTEELLNYTRMFLEEEKRHSAIRDLKPPETDTDEELPSPKILGEQRRRLSRQTSRSKSKARGKSQSVKVNTLRKSHSGTLKKKKMAKTPSVRSRKASIVDATPILKKKQIEAVKHNSWLFSGSHKGEARREGSTEDAGGEDDHDASTDKDKDSGWRPAGTPSGAGAGAGAGGGRGVNRAESCRERDAPRRGKHRNASDPNRLTAAAHNHHDLEPGAATAPSGSSSSSSLSSRSNESNTVPAEQQASASDWSDEDEPLAAQWADSLPPRALDSLSLDSTQRKRQEVIHELIVSEGSHVRWLRVLGGVFLRPLEKTALLPLDELRQLLPNLPQVRERHAKLYADLKALRSDPEHHVVPIRPVAEALLSTLGDSGYSPCLARFCKNQRMALDALKERRRKHKELHQFLSSREQLPLCGRLQLRDLLACVWQRLTKYQLLLESILKTVNEEGDDRDSPEDIETVRRALHVAKEVLHSVDTAIRTAENEHRLRTIQNKLEVRISCAGSEWDEARRLDLTTRTLRMEGELSIRNDSNKKMTVLALMLEDALVLLQREGDKFVLRPINPPSQQTLLSPLIKWEKVLFRPNAAVRHTFFLMNINGVQMHELSAGSANEYATWVRHMTSLPLAKPELRPSLTPHHAPSRSADDSGINVSRNPSDASEKSTSSAPADDESERDRASVDRASERDRTSVDRDEKRIEKSVEREERRSVDKEEEREEKHKPRRPTVGRITTHMGPPCPLAPPAAVAVAPAVANIAHTATTTLTHQERLRRLDAGISSLLRAKAVAVAELLGVPRDSFAQVAELAVADAMGQVDVCDELRLSGSPAASPAPLDTDVHQLLLAAQAQANQLTLALSAATAPCEAAAVRAVRDVRAGRGAGRRNAGAGRCDSCRSSDVLTSSPLAAPSVQTTQSEDNKLLEAALDDKLSERLQEIGLDKDLSYDMLPDLNTSEYDVDDALDSSSSAALLAARVLPLAGSLQSSLGRLLSALPAIEARAQRARSELTALREANDALRAARGLPPAEEISFSKEGPDPVSIQDHPSNGG